MDRISIKLLIPAFLFLVNCTYAMDHLSRQRIILEKWKEGPSAVEIDTMLEKHIQDFVKAGWNELEIRRQFHYVQRSVALDILDNNGRPIEAFAFAKSQNPNALLFKNRPPERRAPSSEKKYSCACAIL